MSKRTIAIAIVVILLVGGLVWAYLRTLPDPQVEKIKQMQAEAFKENATPEERQQSFQLVRQEMEKLSPGQRDEVRQQMGEAMQRRMDERISAYFALPPEQRVAYLDNQIKEMEQRRKEWESHRAQSGPSGGRGQAGQSQSTGGSQGGPGAQPGNPQGAGGPPRDRSPEARLRRHDQRLDRSTAQQRAQRSAYFADLQQRRIQLGLPPVSWHHGPGPAR
jgi:hypothetical protein